MTWPRCLGRMSARLLLGWAVFVALLVGLGKLVTGPLHDQWPFTVEDRVNTGLQGWRTERWNGLTHLMTWLGNTQTIIALAVVVAIVMRLAYHRWRESLFVLACTLGQSLVFVVTTTFIDRHRPDVPKLDGSPPTSSFPSGHTSASLSLYLAIGIVIAWRTRRTWVRWLAPALLLLLPAMVVFARLYRGMHHPSDIVGSMVNATLCLTLAWHVVLHGRLPEGEPDPHPLDHATARTRVAA